MSPGGFVSLLAATALSAASAVALLVAASDPSEPRMGAGDPMFSALQERLPEVRQIELDHPAYRLQLDWDDGIWRASSHGGFPVKSAEAVGLLTSLAAMIRVEPKTADPDWYGHIRVAGPEAEVQREARGTFVRVVAEGGRPVADAILGARSLSIGYSRLGGSFVRPRDQAQSWLVEGRAQVPQALSDWFDPLLHIPGPEIARVAVLSGTAVELEVEKVDFQTGEFVTVFFDDTLGEPGSQVDPDALRNLAQVLVSATAEDVRARNEVLVGEQARAIRFVTRNGVQLDARLGGADGETQWVVFDVAALPDATAEGLASAEMLEARLGQWAFLLPERRMALLRSPHETWLLDPEELQERLGGGPSAEDTPGGGIR